MIEAGSTARHYLVPMPFACGRVFYNAKLNWGFETEPEPFADNRVLTRAAGKVLGGGSSINGMLYTRGHHRDYDQWAQLGCTGWAFSDVLPYFKRSETNWRGATPVHGGDGPLSVSRHMPDKIYTQIAESARRLGYRVTDDFERDAPDGFGIPDFTTHKGRRGSAAKRYVDPIGNRRNLTIETGAQVTRLLLEGRRAVGVEYAIGGKLKQVRAGRELVLSAGAYNSLKLL